MLFKCVLLLFWIGMGDAIQENKNWIENYGIWYFMSPYELNFTSAIEYCLEEGANIAIVTDREQDLFLKQNGFYGWIGLTNTASEQYNTPITQSTNRTVRPSFRDNWYWTVQDWKLLSPGIYSDINLYPHDAANADNNSAVLLKGDPYWRIVPSASTYKVICEWQCRVIEMALYSDLTNKNSSQDISGEYKISGYLNQRRYYNKEEDIFIYYRQSSSVSHWIIYTELSFIGYFGFLGDNSFSPIYNTTAWMGSPAATFDIQLICKATITTEKFTNIYRKTAYQCTGFNVYQDTTSFDYLYLYRVQGTPYWCIGDAPCSVNMSVCNTHTSPFPDMLTGHWVPPDKINYRSTTSEPYVSITIIGEDEYEPDTETPETENASITPEFEPPKVNYTYTIAIGVGCSVAGVCVIVAVAIAAACIRRRVRNTRQPRIHDSSESQQSTEYYNICHSGDQRLRQLSATAQSANVVKNFNHQYVNHNQLLSVEIAASGSTPDGSHGTTSPYTSLSAVPRIQHHQVENNVVEYQQLQSLTHD